MESHSLTVPRTSRYVVLRPTVSRVEEVWLVCHGYGQLASRFIRAFEAIDDGKRLIVAPEALSRFYVSGHGGPHGEDDKVGASWMTREDRDAEIVDYVTYLDLVVARVFENVARASVRIVAFGFSQGAATICRWASVTRTPPDHLILWGGCVPVELMRGEGGDGLRRAALTIVSGDRDPVVPAAVASEHADELQAAGVCPRFVSFSGGHEIDRKALAELAGELFPA